MIISRETDYAIRILRALADGHIHPMGELFEKEYVPTRFGYKIVNKLRDAGMVACTKGRTGGCQLLADLHEVSLFDVIEVMGNERRIKDQPISATESDERTIHDHTREQLLKLQAEISETLKNISVYQVIFD